MYIEDCLKDGSSVEKQISVIVPVYNVARYLRQCLKSICDQSYRNLEIILVDDGSLDQSGFICDEYSKRDPRIKVIHKQNQGLGEARNTGLDHCSGTYVYFVDSDDWLEPNMLENMMKEIEAADADMAMCGFKRCGQNGAIENYPIVRKRCVLQGKDVQSKIFLPMVAQKSTVGEDFTINMCVWANLYRKSIIDKSHIRFLSERQYLSEDICFNLQYLLQSARVVMLPEMYYCYRYNPTSLTSRYKGDEYGKLVLLYQKVCQLTNQVNVLSEIEHRPQRFFLTKIREIFFRLVGCATLSWKNKYTICKKILNDSTLQGVLKEYPIQRYKMKYKIPALFMRCRCSGAVLILFYFYSYLLKR